MLAIRIGIRHLYFVLYDDLFLITVPRHTTHVAIKTQSSLQENVIFLMSCHCFELTRAIVESTLIAITWRSHRMS